MGRSLMYGLAISAAIILVGMVAAFLAPGSAAPYIFLGAFAALTVTWTWLTWPRDGVASPVPGLDGKQATKYSPCPWCGKAISWHPGYISRPFTCTECHEPVKEARAPRRWLYTPLPIAIVLVTRALGAPLDLGLTMVTALMAIVGLYAYYFTARLERGER